MIAPYRLPILSHLLADFSRFGQAFFGLVLMSLMVRPALALELEPYSGPVPTRAAKGPTLPASVAAKFGQQLPDGRVATSGSGDIRTVWLSQPTGRYGHGVLGDSIEAGGVIARLADGSYQSFSLPQDSVFEDLVPRLADLDGDGRSEITLVRAYLRKGAAVTVLGLRDGKLQILAEAPAIGRANRWLNPSIVEDLDGSGRKTIGLVRTPHIGGQLQLWRFAKGKLRLVGKANGFSNHSIGSRALGLSAVLSHKGKKRIILPDARQSQLIILDASSLKPLGRVALPARPVADFVVKRDGAGKQSLYLSLADGKRYRLTDGQGRYFD